MRSKKELQALPYYELTLPEFTWCWPDLLCFDHYAAVEQALKEGKTVPPKVRACYPSLSSSALAVRKKGRK